MYEHQFVTLAESKKFFEASESYCKNPNIVGIKLPAKFRIWNKESSRFRQLIELLHTDQKRNLRSSANLGRISDQIDGVWDNVTSFRNYVCKISIWLWNNRQERLEIQSAC